MNEMKPRAFAGAAAFLTVLALATPAHTQVSGRGGLITPNGAPRSGLFIPALPLDLTNSRPYIDYTLTISLPGLYTIDLVSSNPGTYDPYLRLISGGRQLASNDNGGGSNSARISQILMPGTYTVRVTSARRGAIPVPTPFTLRVNSQTIPGGIPTPAIPEGLPIDIPIPQL
jgi:hypothetical protein